jgi:hypothetical protein
MQRKRRGAVCRFDGLNVDKKGDVELNIVMKGLTKENVFPSWYLQYRCYC